MLQYLKKKDRKETLILLDPHGDIATQVARFKEHRAGDNLILIDPSLKKGFTPCINPLDMGSNSTPEEINYMAECLTEVFKEIVGAESSLTANMETLLKAVLTVLLIREGSTLKDLQTFLRDEENEELIAFAIQHSPKGQRHFFESAFYDRNYTATKNALYTKIQSLLNSQTFYNLTIGKSTIDLREAMNSRKTIVFNLSKGVIGQQTSPAFGRFIVGMLQGFAFQRQSTPEYKRVPTHIFIDEFQNFITPSIKTILDEARKYALHLTLAQQFYGQDTSPNLRGAILNNTAVKIAGTGEGASLNEISKFMTGATKEELQNCEMGSFYLKVKKQRGFLNFIFSNEYAHLFRVTTSFLGFRHSMKSEQWEGVKDYQLKHYYAPIGGEKPPVTVEQGITHLETIKPPQNANFHPLREKGIVPKLPL